MWNLVFCEEMTFPAHLFQKKSKKLQGILAVVDLLYCWMIWKTGIWIIWITVGNYKVEESSQV